MALSEETLNAILTRAGFDLETTFLSQDELAALRAVAEATVSEVVTPERLDAFTLVWGTPGDIELKSDGGGEYASTYKLNERGIKNLQETLLQGTE